MAGCLIVSLLQRRRLHLMQQAGVRLRIMDATTVSRPGAKGPTGAFTSASTWETCA